MSFIEKLFGKANPPAGKKYDFVYADLRNCRPGLLVISWGARGCGFGELTIFLTKDGIVFDTECMSKQFCDELIEYTFNKAIHDPPERAKPMTFEETQAEFDKAYGLDK